VSVKHAGSLATASTAEFRCSQHLLILRDDQGLAEVVDAATGHAMRGRELTYDLSGERILTETSEGARTWITLTPEGKDGRSLEPQTRH
jgi:lipopolysaccharide export system protein LptA